MIRKGSPLRLSLTFMALGATLGLAQGCAEQSSADTMGPDSSSHWLSRCGTNADCGGALECLCGVCTTTCGTALDCGELDADATCSTVSECSSPAQCILACESESDCPANSNCASGRCAGGGEPEPASPEPEGPENGEVDATDEPTDAAPPPENLAVRDSGVRGDADANAADRCDGGPCAERDCEELKDSFWSAKEAASACVADTDCTQDYELPTWCDLLANEAGDTAAVVAAYSEWTAQGCSNLQGGGNCLGGEPVATCSEAQCIYLR